MSITLILHGKQRRKLHLPKQRLAWVGGILFSLLTFGGGWLWQSWHQKMEALEVALAVAEQQSVDQSGDEACEQLAMLAAQVGNSPMPVLFPARQSNRSEFGSCPGLVDGSIRSTGVPRCTEGSISVANPEPRFWPPDPALSAGLAVIRNLAIWWRLITAMA